MQKVFHKVALATLILSSSVFAAELNLLTVATNGSVDAEKASVLKLNDSEMSEIIGGSYTYRGYNVSTGIAQTWGSLTETYNGSKLWLIAEKYGDTLSNGYAVYLSATSNNLVSPSKVYSSRGLVYNAPKLITNPQTYAILSPYINMALNTLTPYKPTYR